MAQHVFHDSIVRICAGMEAIWRLSLKSQTGTCFASSLIQKPKSSVRSLWAFMITFKDLDH